jgi:hypothetical protein
MATGLKLPFGLREGQLFHIADVANGLACACRCPSCGARLVARNQGKQKVAHFAHYQAPDCPYGLQTALHLAAKEVFLTHRTFCLPGVTGHFDFTEEFWASFAFDASFYEACVPGTIEVPDTYAFPARYVEVEQVTLECKTGDIVPDIVLQTAAGPLLVEIAVTHFVDEQKRAKLQRLGIPTIEIDLSKEARDLDVLTLTELLIHQTTHKSWAFNAKLEAKITARRTRYFEAMRPYFEEQHAEELQDQQAISQQVASEESRRAAVQHQHTAEQQKREQRQQFYESQTKAFAPIQTANYGAVNQVTGCPEPQHLLEGKRISLVEKDCLRCAYFRGYGTTGNTVICLHQYYLTKQRQKANRKLWPAWW